MCRRRSSVAADGTEVVEHIIARFPSHQGFEIGQEGALPAMGLEERSAGDHRDLSAAVRDWDWARGSPGAPNVRTGVVMKLFDGQNAGGRHGCHRDISRRKVKCHKYTRQPQVF
jgi:hypothetical protein